jgi:hypothetical protein
MVRARTRSLLKKSPKALYRQVGDLPHNGRAMTYMQVAQVSDLRKTF